MDDGRRNIARIWRGRREVARWNSRAARRYYAGAAATMDMMIGELSIFSARGERERARRVRERMPQATKIYEE
jgi:hypothetical protein